MTDFNNIPDFDSLPAVKDMPQGCAWGIFDRNGQKDYLGCFNLLTPEVKKEAVKEAREGVSISLNWPLNAIAPPGFGRAITQHKVLDALQGPYKMHSFDDELNFNTQASSQWDSLCHYGHQPTGLYYNNTKPTSDNLSQGYKQVDKSLPTLNHWHEHGCLVGRGVLLDYRAYAQAKGIEYSCFSDHVITVNDLEQVAAFQGTRFKYGDILIIRTGFTDDIFVDNGEEQISKMMSGQIMGVLGNKETARWLWNHHFSAVASDNMAFECLPPQAKMEGSPDITDGFPELGKSKITLSYLLC